MTRGKYAAKAANRLAELDAQIVADLRAKLAAVTTERDEARREAAGLKGKLASEVNRAARGLADLRITEATQAVAEEREARAADRKRLAVETFAVFRKHDAWPNSGILADLLSVFGLSDRAGDLVPMMDGAPHNRNSRRLTAGRLRTIQAQIDDEAAAGSHQRWI